MRVGGWHGWAQTIADTFKLVLKEDIIHGQADKKLFILAPFIVFMGSFAIFAAIPFSKNIMASGVNIGIFYILAISSVVVIGIIMAGWASNNKWSLYGAMRSAAQIVSYEIPVALSILSVIMLVGTLEMREISLAQQGGFWKWFIFRNPFTFLAFFVYFISATAEVNRMPFDIPEAESELVAGFHTEYSGLRWSIFFLSEYANILAVSAIATTLFLGGWESPLGGVGLPGFGIIWFLLKAIFLVFVIMWFRWTFPRLSVDQLMYACWKVMIPLAFLNIVGVGIWMKLTGQI
ncbi:MAG: NADH-quinone oxidoreductase subunit NuoH, partial [Fidelibacterota bacterium]